MFLVHNVHHRNHAMLTAALPPPFPLARLVMVDVAFYTENLLSLRTLENMDLSMVEIWEHKR